MTIYLTRDDVLAAATHAIGAVPVVRDYGLLDSAIIRPQSSVFGKDAYPDEFEKAAALLESLARNHPLIDGNKRTAWAATWVFLDVNGFPLHEKINSERAETFINRVAQGQYTLHGIMSELEVYHYGEGFDDE